MRTWFVKWFWLTTYHFEMEFWRIRPPGWKTWIPLFPKIKYLGHTSPEDKP